MVSYPRAYVTSDFPEATGNWTDSHPLSLPYWESPDKDQRSGDQNISSIYALQYMAKNFTRLSPKDCIATYIDLLNATQALVLVISNVTSTQNNGSSLILGYLIGRDSWTWGTRWICISYWHSYMRWCGQEWASSIADNWIVSYGGPDSTKAEVGYCLVGEAGDNGQRCGFSLQFDCSANRMLLYTV